MVGLMGEEAFAPPLPEPIERTFQQRQNSTQRSTSASTYGWGDVNRIIDNSFDQPVLTGQTSRGGWLADNIVERFPLQRCWQREGVVCVPPSLDKRKWKILRQHRYEVVAHGHNHCQGQSSAEDLFELCEKTLTHWHRA